MVLQPKLSERSLKTMAVPREAKQLTLFSSRSLSNFETLHYTAMSPYNYCAFAVEQVVRLYLEGYCLAR